MLNFRTIAGVGLLLAAASAAATPDESEAYGICKNGIQARYGEQANVTLRRVRARRGVVTVDVRVAGLEDGPSRLRCRIGGDDELVIVDPETGSEIERTTR